ncbi:MAG: GNAT family N-acetyltransferase [Acidobacteriota bacterium]
MGNLSFEIADRSDATVNQQLSAGLNRHAAGVLDQPGFRPLTVVARDDEGALVGGVTALVNWNWLDISLLWVDSSYRGQGLGRRLVETLEQASQERGCTRAHVDTFSFQARAFYERLGYRVFAKLGDYPPGHQRIYLEKTLTAEPQIETVE